VSAFAALERQGVLPVLRSRSVDDAVATARACQRAGMTVVEFTHSTPDVERAVAALADDEIVAGIGTVTDADQVRAGAAAGARFIVSFCASAELVGAAREVGIEAIPGALTPSEVLACWSAGAAAVKLFPAHLIDPAYLRDLRTVIPEVRLVVSGGIKPDADSIRPWLAHGAVAVALGEALGTVAVDGDAEVERRCRTALEAVTRPTTEGR
jgi:2-dehydro-3-deoxyphosphogluconate aldolase / (4S)-4-hydroxy-2-oxoglutarate aldolase